jgi:adenylate cyclase
MAPSEAPLQNRNRPTGFPALYRNHLFLIVAGVTLGVLVFLWLRLPITEFMELKLYDLKFLYRGARPPSPDIVLVAVDDDSVKEVGRWPWSREVIATLIGRIKEAEAKVIGLDIIFAERQETAAMAALQHLRRGLLHEKSCGPQIMALLAQEEKRADVDRRLARVIGLGPPTILGFFFVGVGGETVAPRLGQALGPKAISASSYNMVRWLDRDQRRLPLMGATGVEVNLPEITEQAAGGGYFNMIPDPDGIVRWLPLAVSYGPDIFAPLTLVTLQHYRQKAPLGITLSRFGVEQIRLGREVIPVDRYGRMFINYLGPPGVFPTYSAARVLSGKLPKDALKDKLVLVGATAVGIFDLRVTPFSGICPGLEIQGTVLDNILRQDFIYTPANPFLTTASIILAVGLIFGFLLPRFGAVGAIGVTLVVVLAYIAMNFLVFRYFGLQLEVFYPTLEMAAVYTGVTLQRFLTEERERVRIKKAFQSFVAPEVVNQIIRHPERLRLGGERRELSILFSDIRGFTTLAETMEPEALVEVLHGYLNPMSEIVVQHGGTLDKYIGDAIMALFGAPLEQPDHGERACRTALEMVQKLRELDREWLEQGWPALKIGIGINSGLVSVGNMGSNRLFDYTAIGDNVNLASRLEGLNKHYGTEILVAASTVQHVGPDFLFREVDLVRVKGKKHPIAIYELLGQGEPAGKPARFLELYHEGLARFREGRWGESIEAFQAAAAINPQDALCVHYLQLSQKYAEKPPGLDWDGVTTMLEK